MTELAIRDGVANGTLALAGDQIEWTAVQRAALVHIGIADAPVGDQQVFMHVAQSMGLDPFRRQIYMIARKDKGVVKWTIQTAIDGFRLVAEDHPQYAGTLDPQWCGPDGVWRDIWTDQRPPVAARVVVLRHDRQHPICLPVKFYEFAATNYEGGLQGQWKTKPAHMIAKCAEAASLRKAFPRQLSGVYTDDEMAHVENQQRQGRVFDHAGAVTAAELTGAAPARDWDGEVTAAVDAGDIETLRTLWSEAAGQPAVRERITNNVQALTAEAQRADDVQDAEVVDEPDPRDVPAAEPAPDDAAAVDGFWGEQDGGQGVNRAEFIDAVRAQAWDAGKTCPTCDGEGTVRPGRRIVHCVGSFTGADWDEDTVVAAIESAREVRWLDGQRGGHNLGVLTDKGRTWRFQVDQPDAQPPS